MMNQIQFHPSAIDASDCISVAWNIVKNNYGLFLGISLLAMVLMSCLPCVNIFLAGPIMGGVFYCFLKAMRNEQVEFGEMFKGFENFVPLMVIGIIQAIPEIMAQGIRISVNVADFGLKNADRTLYQADPSRLLASGLVLFLIVAGFTIFVVGFAIRISLFFALPLVIEHRLGVGDAIKLSARAAWSNIGGLILLSILEFLIALAGLLMLCVGVFLVMPILFCANAVAYRQVFPDLRQNVSNVPPSPDMYGGSYGRGL
jgi:hypothetical protein